MLSPLLLLLARGGNLPVMITRTWRLKKTNQRTFKETRQYDINDLLRAPKRIDSLRHQTGTLKCMVLSPITHPFIRSRGTMAGMGRDASFPHVMIAPL